MACWAPAWGGYGSCWWAPLLDPFHQGQAAPAVLVTPGHRARGSASPWGCFVELEKPPRQPGSGAGPSLLTTSLWASRPTGLGTGLAGTPAPWAAGREHGAAAVGPGQVEQPQSRCVGQADVEIERKLRMGGIRPGKAAVSERGLAVRKPMG